MRARVIHSTETDRYRVQFWRWWWPFWMTETEYGEGGAFNYQEFKSEADARQFLYACDLGTTWRVVEPK